MQLSTPLKPRPGRMIYYYGPFMTSQCQKCTKPTVDVCNKLLYNLLGNAIKFAKPGTRIELAVTIVDTSNRPDNATNVPMDTKSQSIVHLSTRLDDLCRRTSLIFKPIDSTNYERSKQGVPTVPPIIARPTPRPTSPPTPCPTTPPTQHLTTPLTLCPTDR